MSVPKAIVTPALCERARASLIFTHTAASFKTDTTALVERSKTVPVLANLFKLPHLLLLGGGIVIKLGDEVIGAIGAAGAPGGDLDEACAHAGLDKIKDQLK